MMLEYFRGAVNAVMSTAASEWPDAHRHGGGSPNESGHAASCGLVSLPERLDGTPDVGESQVRQSPTCNSGAEMTGPQVCRSPRRVRARGTPARR